MLSYKRVFLYLFALCCLLFSAAAYLQYAKGIEPCLLCMVQRIFVFLLAMTFLGATLHNHNARSKKIYGVVAMVFTVLGFLAASRQVWLQHLPPDQAAYCVPGFSFLLRSADWSTILKFLITGTPDCSKIHWTFIGLSVADWSVFFFVIFGAAIVWQYRRKN